MNLELMKTLTTLNVSSLYKILLKFLKSKGYTNIKKGQTFIMAEGEIPVCLIAHMDTVNIDFYNKVPDMSLYDPEQDIFHVVSGCTLDDRLGIYSIIQIILDGYKPSIIFTDLEETGGQGIEEFVTRYTKCPFDINFIIELDRQGENDSVYYSCNNKKFQKYINSFGFKTAQGTFTDCLILGETWDIAAVNLSCGYLLEHTIYEYAHLKWTHNTIDKVEKILQDTNNAIKFKYNALKKNEKHYNQIYPKFKMPDTQCLICGAEITHNNSHFIPDNKYPYYVCSSCYKQYYLDMEEDQPWEN